MKKSVAFRLLIVTVVALLGTARTDAGAAEAQPAALHAYLRQGIEKAFNLENQAAAGLFQRAVELDRENPVGHAFLALAHLFALEMEFDPDRRAKLQALMLQEIGLALDCAQMKIERRPRDGQAYFATALAKIVNVRWAISQKRYLLVAQETAHVWECLEKVKAEEPWNHDIYFPMGLLHYHLDHLPAVTRFLSSLLITAADRRRGLQELQWAAQNGDLLRELAQAELSSVYIHFEGQPSLALPIALELKRRFPRNYNFLFTLANTLSELRRSNEAFAVAREIEAGIRTGRPPYVPELQPRLDHLLGRILFNEGDYVRAADYFRKALVTTVSVYNARNRASALVRLGMIHDIRRERKQAEEYYHRALAVEGGEGIAQTEARRYLKTPYEPRVKAPPP